MFKVTQTTKLPVYNVQSDRNNQSLCLHCSRWPKQPAYVYSQCFQSNLSADTLFTLTARQRISWRSVLLVHYSQYPEQCICLYIILNNVSVKNVSVDRVFSVTVTGEQRTYLLTMFTLILDQRTYWQCLQWPWSNVPIESVYSDLGATYLLTVFTVISGQRTCWPCLQWSRSNVPIDIVHNDRRTCNVPIDSVYSDLWATSLLTVCFHSDHGATRLLTVTGE